MHHRPEATTGGCWPTNSTLTGDARAHFVKILRYRDASFGRFFFFFLLLKSEKSLSLNGTAAHHGGTSHLTEEEL